MVPISAWTGGPAVTVPCPDELAAAGIPAIAVERVEACPLCDARESAPFAEGFDYELRTCRNRWRFVRCLGCDHVWLDPRPAVSALGTIYPSTYYAYDYGRRIHPLAVRAKGWLDDRKLDVILRRLGRAPRSYLDVGCGDGRFLLAMERRGVPRERLFGLELDGTLVDRLRRQGYQVSRARVEDAVPGDEAGLDLVTMFHVVEHLDRPVAVVRKLAGWLAPGGLLALETPNRASLDARLFRRTYWGGYHFPRHWQLFTTDGALTLLRRAGLEPVGVAYQTGHSFWLYAFHHALRYRYRLPRLAARFDPIGTLLPLAIVTGFDKFRAAMGFRTSAVMVIGRRPESEGGTGVAP